MNEKTIFLMISIIFKLIRFNEVSINILKFFFMKTDKQFLKFLVIRKPKNSHHNTEEQ